jgi:hypothetical protein
LKVLLDNCVPKKLGNRVTGHSVEHASTRGWAALSNGHLLAAANDAGVDVMLTTDRSIEHQQGSFPIPVVIVDSLFNAVDDLVKYLPAIQALLNQPLQARVYMVPRIQ